jgi:site-specific recombinase XerD
MPFLKKFIKLMKDELSHTEKKHSFSWIVDESKCLSIEEVKKLRNLCKKATNCGLKHRKFTPIRNWFMVELGLNAGLRVEEMASLKCGNLLIDKDRSSIIVTGKGNKKRAVWISSVFKKTCIEYLDYKKTFGYGTDADDYLLNNLKGNMITKRALQKFFKILIRKAGLPEHYYIHCLRHTYTTFLLKASNYNYRFAQQQLGHASIKTTQTYASVIESEGRKAVEKIYR